MNLQIKYLNIQPSENLDQYLKRRVDFAFSRFSNQILSIQIRLEDLNGPKGGYDQWRQQLPGRSTPSRPVWKSPTFRQQPFRLGRKMYARLLRND